MRLWRIPEGGLVEPTNDCEATLAAHQEKVLTLQFHPLATGVLATTAQDRRCIVWDGEQPRLELEPHPDQVGGVGSLGSVVRNTGHLVSRGHVLGSRLVISLIKLRRTLLSSLASSGNRGRFASAIIWYQPVLQEAVFMQLNTCVISVLFIFGRSCHHANNYHPL